METLLAISLGIGLSAACGFRVFVPLLVMSVASLSGHLTLAPGFHWIGTYPALVTFSVATVVEIGGYYIPGSIIFWIQWPHRPQSWPDSHHCRHGQHTSPMLKWTLAAIAGGGAAGLVQGTTVLPPAEFPPRRPVVWAILSSPRSNSGGALSTSILALLVPLLAVGLIAVFLFVVGRKIVQKTRKSQTLQPGAS